MGHADLITGLGSLVTQLFKFPFQNIQSFATVLKWPERLRIICKGFGGITNIKHFGDLQFEASDSRPHIAAILKIVFATRLKLCWPTKRFDMASNSHDQPAQKLWINHSNRFFSEQIAGAAE